MNIFNRFKFIMIYIKKDIHTKNIIQSKIRKIRCLNISIIIDNKIYQIKLACLMFAI